MIIQIATKFVIQGQSLWGDLDSDGTPYLFSSRRCLMYSQKQFKEWCSIQYLICTFLHTHSLLSYFFPNRKRKIHNFVKQGGVLKICCLFVIQKNKDKDSYVCKQRSKNKLIQINIQDIFIQLIHSKAIAAFGYPLINIEYVYKILKSLST